MVDRLRCVSKLIFFFFLVIYPILGIMIVVVARLARWISRGSFLLLLWFVAS